MRGKTLLMAITIGQLSDRISVREMAGKIAPKPEGINARVMRRVFDPCQVCTKPKTNRRDKRFPTIVSMKFKAKRR